MYIIHLTSFIKNFQTEKLLSQTLVKESNHSSHTQVKDTTQRHQFRMTIHVFETTIETLEKDLGIVQDHIQTRV